MNLSNNRKLSQACRFVYNIAKQPISCEPHGNENINLSTVPRIQSTLFGRENHKCAFGLNM
jgi:hypothetical protein